MRRSPCPRPAAALLGLLIAPLVLTACGDSTDDAGDAGPGDDTPGVSLTDLDGRTFVASDVDDPERVLVPDTEVRLSFDGGRLMATAGCNSMSADARIEDGRLVVPPLASTQMGCDPDRMEQDTWLAGFLGDGPAISLDGATLTLRGDATQLSLDEEIVEPAALEGTAWRLETLYSGSGADGTASSVPAGAEKAGLSMADGRLQVATGCNRGSAPVTYDDATLTVGPLALTKKACDQPVAAVEQTFLRVLDGTPGYVIDGRSLTVTSADGSAALGFRAD